ncbi:flagellar brake protein [Thalassobacillus devorans]|uniref:flagellar brake protein n=1 Tax=Thalassobacillus devorans TaxID=279813 RepID=UPI00048A92C7|nr:flagellar brake domain-containing protein [Thalassobacillus devorans]
MVEIGAPVSLELIHTDCAHDELFKSKIVDKKDDYLFLTYPVGEKTRKTGIFLEGTQFKLSFVGKDQSVYLFETSVLARKKLKIPVLVFYFPKESETIRIQRRKYVRVETAVDVAVLSTQRDVTPFTTVTLDISGGGAAIVLPESHQVKHQENLNLMLVFPMNSGEIRYVEAEGTVIRIFNNKGVNRESASIEFTNITEHQRQTIIQFCFERQLYMRRRGIQ